MLARLERIDGVEAAEVDHSGQLLRLRLDRLAVIDDVRAELRELGYAALPAEGASAEARWYDGRTVLDLSREEAGIIAGRVAIPFARVRRMDARGTERLRAAVAAALGAVFSTHAIEARTPTGALRDECSRAVTQAATPLVGQDGARDLAAALWADLDRAEGRSP